MDAHPRRDCTRPRRDSRAGGPREGGRDHFGIAATALAFGGIFLLVAVALGIANLLGWPAWTGFLIVAILLCIGGFLTLSSGRKQLASVHALPGETVTTLKENSEWIAKRLSSVRK